MPSQFEPLNLLLLLPVGTSILLGVRLVFGPSDTGDVGTLRRILTFVGTLLLMSGVLGLLIGMSSGMAVVNGLMIAVAIVSTVRWLRKSNCEGLFWALTVAAEKNVPLHQVSWAFASDRSNTLGTRAWRLGDLLQHGTPLPLAIEQARLAATFDLRLAARVGQILGCLPKTLREGLESEQSIQKQLRPITDHFMYLIALGFVIAANFVFMIWRILPSVNKIAQEYDVDLNGSMTQLLLDISPELEDRIVILSLGSALVGGTFLLLFLTRFLPTNLVGIHWITLPLDRTRVMRAIAWCVAAGRPLLPALQALAELYPRYGIGRRLSKAANEMKNGSHWAECLLRARLIRRSDVAVLRATEQAGNLEWGLREMADRNLRTLHYRLEWWRTMLVPVSISLAGIFVAAIGWSLFEPLVKIFEASAG